MSLPAKNDLHQLVEGQHRKARLAFSILLLGIVLSACSEAPPEEITEETVDQAWTRAAECLTNRGYDVSKDRNGNTWSLDFGGEPEGVVFDLRYKNCVGEAEAITLAFLRTQVPEGAERIALAAEFQSCLGSAGLEEPVAYDPNNPDSSAVLADAIEKMGYSTTENPEETGGPDVADDPRFREVLGCFDTYELLFPDRYED